MDIAQELLLLFEDYESIEDIHSLWPFNCSNELF